MRTVSYKGIYRSGTHVSGQISLANLAEWVEKKWRARWQRLEVSDDTGQVVAGIADGIWWSE